MSKINGIKETTLNDIASDLVSTGYSSTSNIVSWQSSGPQIEEFDVMEDSENKGCVYKQRQSKILSLQGRINYDDVLNNIDFYNKKVQEIVNSSSSKREAIANLALFMATEFPQLPYSDQNSSGHDGADLHGFNWIYNLDGAIDYDSNNIIYRTLDCSGLVNWCFVNSGLEIPSPIEGSGGAGTVPDYTYAYGGNYDGKLSGDNIEAIAAESIANTNVGDLILYWDPNDPLYPDTFSHIGIVVGVNAESNEIMSVHISLSGDGTNITTMKVNSDNSVTVSADQVGANGSNRIGNTYFTHILHLSDDVLNSEC